MVALRSFVVARGGNTSSQAGESLTKTPLTEAATRGWVDALKPESPDLVCGCDRCEAASGSLMKINATNSATTHAALEAAMDDLALKQDENSSIMTEIKKG